MSSLATAPERAGQGVRAPTHEPVRFLAPTGDAILGLGLAAALFALAFLTSGSTDPSTPVSATYTWSEIAITVLGAAGCATVLLVGGRGRAWGALTVGLFAAFTAFAALSILWSVVPDWSWFGANQLFAYLAVFAGAAGMARLFPERWPGIVGGVAAGMAALSAYALLAKVFPATLAASNIYGRVQAPFGYWNALGVSAALGLPACLWASARRSRGVVLRALSAPALTLVIAVVLLSYSRSAVLMAVVAAAAWIAFVPLRLRTTAMLAVGGAGAVVVILWAQASHGVTGNQIGRAAQDRAGHSFGLVLLAVLVVVAIIGLGTSVAIDRVAISASVRRRIGLVLLVLVALIPVGGIAALAASSRGLTGEISHGWSVLTNPNAAQPTDTSSRITALGSSRPVYWDEGITAGENALLKGVGELGYGVARLRYATKPEKTDQAHSYLVQAFADLGLVGLAITLALLVAWCVAAARPLAFRERWRSLTPDRATEREGLVALAAIAVSFGVQSAIDWTWFFPGVTVPTLIAAGWLAGRGPLQAPVGHGDRPRPLRQRPGAGAMVTVLATVALAGAWLIWEPLHSSQEVSAAINANTNSAAFAHARAAASSNPLSVAPLNELSALYEGVGDKANARSELAKASGRQPEN
ncbi:MAG: hypothetical protein WAL63_10335, partial [Solirubrobacteraceae bacterium]